MSEDDIFGSEEQSAPFDLGAIEQAALAATQGPWRYSLDKDDGVHVRHEYVWGPKPSISGAKNGDYFSKDMQFIAAANPAVVLELVRRLRAAEQRLANAVPAHVTNLLDAYHAESWNEGKYGNPYKRKSDDIRAEIDALHLVARATDELEPVTGDILPKVGSRVLIHLGRQDEWVEQTVTGYYVWGDLGGNESLHRVFVRVVDDAGYSNSRMLHEVRPVEAALPASDLSGSD